MALTDLLQRARQLGFATAEFREPDFGDATTAIAIMGDDARRLLSSLPLALKFDDAA